MHSTDSDTTRTSRLLTPAAAFARRMAKPLLALLAAAAVIPSAHAQLSVTNGLQLWLNAGSGVVADSTGVVTLWNDLSGNGNNANPLESAYGGLGVEMPLLVTNIVNHQPALYFDGATNVLEIFNSPSFQPGTNDWTVIVVAERLPNSAGDFPQIIGSRPWTTGSDLGWAVCFDNASGTPNGLVASHLADGSAGHDVPQTLSTSALATNAFQIWQIEEHQAARTTAFIKNGNVDQASITAMPASPVLQSNPVFIGREIQGGNSRRANMYLAEILVYNRALSVNERYTVTTNLTAKYGLKFVLDIPPLVTLTAPTNNSTLSLNSTLNLQASATPQTPGGSVTSVKFYQGVNLLGTAAAPPYTLPISLQSPGLFAFTAVAIDNLNGASTSAPVHVTITGSLPAAPMNVTNGLQLWLSADSGVTADSGGNVSLWTDRSPNGNNAAQDNGTAIPPAVGLPTNFLPLLLTNAIGGLPAIHFDGVGDYLDIPNSPSLQPGTNDWTVLFVAQRDATSQGDFPEIIGSRPWKTGTDLGWAVAFANTSGLLGSHLADGSAGHDVPGIQSASPLAQGGFQVWEVEEARSVGTTSFYKAGLLDRAESASEPANPVTQADDIYIGREIGGLNDRIANMDLAEVMVFNRVLTAAERRSLSSYLTTKYAVPQIFSANQPPAVSSFSGVTNGQSFTAPASFTLTAVASDSDGQVVEVEFFNGASLLGVATNIPYTLTTRITGPGTFALTAVAVDNLGATGSSTPIDIRVAPGAINLIGAVDYSDTFTTNSVRLNELYNQNTNGAYNVESNSTNPPDVWTPTKNFSFNVPSSSTQPAELAGAQGDPGATTGFAQSGGGDFSLSYGLRSNYVVEINAVFPSDRLDLSSLPVPGDTIGATNSLSIFLRRDSAAGNGIGFYNGLKETGVTNASGVAVKTGVNDNNWHNVAVDFDQTDSAVLIYVDGILTAQVDLTTFGGGAYQNYSNGAVGVGGNGGVFWIDNFQVGSPFNLVGTVDYSDTFTTNAIRTDGLYNNNSGGAYGVEFTSTNAPAGWTPTANFSFNTPQSSTSPATLEAALGDPAAKTGFAQSGGGDFSLAYGLRLNYVVQLNAILPSDRLDVSSLPAPGSGIGAKPGLSVFFRLDTAAGGPSASFPGTGIPGIGIYNGSKETAVTDATGALVLTGVSDENWHAFGVDFDQAENRLGLYVDGTLKANLDLTVFGGGQYQNYTNGAVGAGGSGTAPRAVFWVDNFVVGSPVVPSLIPAAAPVLLSGSLQGGQFTIIWPGSGTLQSAPSVTGPWTTAGTSSPFVAVPTGAMQFYRLLQQ